MTYKRKAALLSALVAVLALANILTLVFDPAKQRSASFAWLDSSFIQAADRIEIYGNGMNGGAGSRTVLIRKNANWVFQGENTELPVKQARVEDLMAALSRKAMYLKRAASAEARSALALEEDRASRILVRGGAGHPLLDLLIGTADALGREVYYRKAGQNEIYSGEDLFTVYTESTVNSWLDLRLFPSEAVPVEAVQQAELSYLGDDGEKRSFMLRRQRGGWAVPGNESDALDNQRVEAWLRAVLEAEGENFGTQGPAVIEKSIILRLGDGSVRSIRAGFIDEERQAAVVSDSDLTYILPDWTVSRLFREESYFVKSESTN